MKLTVLSSEGGVTHVQSEGEITIVDVQKGSNPLEQVLGAGGFAGKVLLNLAGSEFIDSAGVGWLMMTHKRFRDTGGALVVHSPPPLVQHVFQLLQVGTVIPVADDEAGALRMLRGGAS
ncbi:MAG TPA: STAS domain-containing protein [Gemmataceae bacterium]|nr:STAS domain-containing protein [Gemmataceae bacterium]